MKIPSRTPSISAVHDSANGLNQSSCGWIDAAGALPPYTLASATTANRARMRTSAVSRICCVRAESSMPRQQIHVISAIQTTAATMIAKVEFAAESQPKSRYV